MSSEVRLLLARLRHDHPGLRQASDKDLLQFVLQIMLALRLFVTRK